MSGIKLVDISKKSAAKRGLMAVALLTALSACSNSSDKRNEKFAYVEEPVEQLYSRATNRLSKKRYDEAIVFFGEVERQHPFTQWARRASLMTAFAQYQGNDYEDAIATLDRFIAIHPGNKDAGYAYYLKAMCFYERIRDTGRDQGLTENALAAFQDVIKRYPDSEYATDARLKLDLTHDHLAGKEMEVGRWYLRRGQQVAAINRFDQVIERYQTTSHAPEALHRIVEGYLTLGVVPEARRHAAILGYNYPGSRWYQDTYKLFEKRNIILDDPVRKVKEDDKETSKRSVKEPQVLKPPQPGDVRELPQNTIEDLSAPDEFGQ